MRANTFTVTRDLAAPADERAKVAPGGAFAPWAALSLALLAAATALAILTPDVGFVVSLSGALLWVVDQQNQSVKTNGAPAIPERRTATTG